jgi:hypothetical protein
VSDQGGSGETPARPMLRVVRGEPTAEELAALVAVVSARAVAAPEPGAPRRLGSWADPRAQVRAPLTVGPGAWVASARR